MKILLRDLILSGEVNISEAKALFNVSAATITGLKNIPERSKFDRLKLSNLL
jgi:hypothetical protein